MTTDGADGIVSEAAGAIGVLNLKSPSGKKILSKCSFYVLGFHSRFVELSRHVVHSELFEKYQQVCNNYWAASGCCQIFPISLVTDNPGDDLFAYCDFSLQILATH